jgi:phosphoenolpyruvate-protein kinase (PTS system EI component)
MSGRILTGAPASPGAAVGPAWRRAEVGRGDAVVAWEDQDRERDAALAALAEAADELSRLAATLPAEEAEIVESGVLMARDPALLASIEKAIFERGATAANAILLATDELAEAIAAIGDELLAARADDVRSLGRRAARLTTHDAGAAPAGTDLILIADDLGPGDVAELAPALAAIALAAGGATAHAAIMARSLGIPMVTSLGHELLLIADGITVALDADTGRVILEPAEELAEAAATEMEARRQAAQRALARREEPAVTRDGRTVAVLANVASRAELDVAFASGADGVGLLRTELAFLDAGSWPSEQEHVHALEPILAGLEGRRAVVRVLDFGADKAPPFLHGVRARGIELLLGHPDAFLAQLRAIARCSRGRDVRVMLPMVDRAEQLTETARLLARAAREVDLERIPPLGSMIETPSAAACAPAIAACSDFLSIGTNDLTASTLGTDRFASGAGCTHDPRVLRAIAASIAAARAARIPIEVCGEAASDPLMLALLVGLGVDELSVGAARVGVVRDWVRDLSAADAATVADAALDMAGAEEVALVVGSITRELQSA